VVTGMSFSNIVMYFIILTTAATLHAHGLTQIATAREAAEALRPLAGNYAYWLFAIGVIGTGMLAVPVLAGSSAFAIAEAMHWRASLDRPPRLAREFYLVMGVALALGLALNYSHINAVKMLFSAAVLNGLLAPPLIALVVSLTSDPQVMGRHVNSQLLRYLGWATAAIMTLAAGALLITTMAG
jgi:Mn2+/Fe2+ NRAMP family transporter